VCDYTLSLLGKNCIKMHVPFGYYFEIRWFERYEFILMHTYHIDRVNPDHIKTMNIQTRFENVE